MLAGVETCNCADGEFSPMPSLPAESMRALSLPPVSTVNVSAAGNLNAVFVSPV